MGRALHPSQAYGLPWQKPPSGLWSETVAREVAQQLPIRQGAVVRSLLIRHPAFQPPEPPISYSVVAEGMGISVSTVKTQPRRARLRHPELYAAVMLSECSSSRPTTAL
jgi:hypothetical protein